MKAPNTRKGIAVTNVRIPANVREAISVAAAREHRTIANYLIVAAMERLEKTVGLPPARSTASPWQS